MYYKPDLLNLMQDLTLKMQSWFVLKELRGMRMFNFVNIEKIIDLKLYSLVILNRIQK